MFECVSECKSNVMLVEIEREIENSMQMPFKCIHLQYTHSSNRKISIRHNEIDRFICPYLLIYRPLHTFYTVIAVQHSKDRMSPPPYCFPYRFYASDIYLIKAQFILICLLQAIVCTRLLFMQSNGILFVFFPFSLEFLIV